MPRKEEAPAACLVDLDDRPCPAVRLIGRKAYTLARLRTAGFEVPPGFVITTTAAHVVRDHGGSLPPTLRAELVKQWRESQWPVVAVRSSAVCEDQSDASFAGQFETVLQVGTEADLVTAVERVLASAYSERVRVYLAQHFPGIDPDRIVCASLIQPMVDAESAGVVFTVDPVRGRSDRIRLEAVRGLGEALVSGNCTPDLYVVERPGLVVVEQRPAGAHAILTEETVCAIARAALRVEMALDGPQDVEWAVRDDSVTLLQARPITAIAGPPTAADPSHEAQRLRETHGTGRSLWTNLFLAELIPTPTPATLELITAMGTPGSGGPLLALERDLGLGRVRHGLVLDTICGRGYARVDSLERILVDLGLPLRLLPPDDAAAWYRPRADWIHIDWPRLLVGLPRLLLRVPRVLHRASSLVRQAADHFRKHDLPALDRAVAAAPHDLSALPDTTLLQHLDQVHAWCAGPGRRMWERGNLAALLAQAWLRRQTRRILADYDGTSAARLTRGAPGNATLAANAELRDLATTAARIGMDSEEFTHRLAVFLDRYGHRASVELELSAPRWNEQPDAVRAIIASLAGTPATTELAPVEAGHVHVTRPSRKHGQLQRAVDVARRTAFLRETPKFHFLRRFAQLRGAYLEVARRAQDRGFLQDMDDIFQLRRQELPALLAGGSEARAMAREATRRRAYTASVTCDDLPPLLRLDRIEELWTAPPATAAGVGRLLGDPVSAGRVNGRAWVVSDPSRPGVPPPEPVLVTTRADPALTPLFLCARAVVVETGSAVSHAAIVAREYGLPMIVNVPRVTRRVTEGAPLSVDGTTGEVTFQADTGPEEAG